MIETECQQLIVEAVVDGGGRSLKFNNRFMVGVCDLLIKMPLHQPMMLEAKLVHLAPSTVSHVWKSGCTEIQKRFLRDWNDAGMLTGVVSFIQRKGQDVRSLEMAVIPYQQMVNNAWSVYQIDHLPLGDKSERFDNIRSMLRNFANG